MRLALEGGAYQSRTVIAGCQRAVNIFAEATLHQSVTKFVYYPAPGLRRLARPPTPGPARCLYRSNNNQLFAVIGSYVYYVDSSWTFTQLGFIGVGSNICSIADNGSVALLMNGSSNGWNIDLFTHAFTPVDITNNNPPAPQVFGFYGATRVDIQDGYFILNRPNTRQFYTTYLNVAQFDALWFATKNGYSDNLVSAVVQRREIWLIGEKTTEIWYNTGDTTTIPFTMMPGPFIHHGCYAPYSIATSDGTIYWLSQDLNGKVILVRGVGYKVAVVSTRALETEWAHYARADDAVGFCFSQNGHNFYQINFPTADKTYRFDETTEQWHEAVWIDDNGGEHRHRAQCHAFVYDTNVVADWQDGTLYALDPTVYTDDGQPMIWRRGFPHVVVEGNRVIYPGFVLDLDAGAAIGTQQLGAPLLTHTGAPITDHFLDPIRVGPTTVTEPYYYPIETFDLPTRAPDGTSFGTIGRPGYTRPAVEPQPKVWLRWSDDRGHTFGNPVPQSMGGSGQYISQAQWGRLGLARDRVFEVYGFIPGFFAITGAWLDPQPIPLKA